MPRTIVTPGELITSERKKLGSNVHMHEGRIYSTCMGLVEEGTDFINVIPLEGRYRPMIDDLVVGIVTSERFGGYGTDINSYYPAYISRKEVDESLRPGSIISAKIAKVNEINEVELMNVRVFYGGEIISVSPVKVPRIMGRNNSMLELLKQGTNANVLVGKNGRIWAKGGNTKLLEKAIAKIEREAHMENLTNKIAEFLRAENKGAGAPIASANGKIPAEPIRHTDKKSMEMSEGRDI